MDEYTLIDMMFASEPIDTFMELWESRKSDFDWEGLLHMCYCEESYGSVGGDEGYLDNHPINRERLSYLAKLIAFLESNGVVEDEE